MTRFAAAALAALAAAAPASAAVETDDFRYVRELQGPADAGSLRFRVDGPMFGHARVGLPDLRVVDANGQQVPWRRAPAPPDEAVSARVLNSGREGDRAVALLDLGAQRVVRDRIELEIPDRDFVGRATVFGGDTRSGRFTRLATTPVFDVAGAEAHARSTVVVFPPSDFRYYRVAVTNVTAVEGAVASARRRSVEPVPLRASVARTEDESRTRVVIDLRWPKMPVDEIRVESRTERYDREVLIEASNPGTPWAPVGFNRIVHFPGTLTASLPVDVHARFIRLTIFNEDDTPLAAIDAVPLARPRVILVEGGHPLPYRVLYGSATARAPRYDFAQLPASAVPASRAATLGPERPNPDFAPPADTRSFLERNDWLVEATLALVAVALALVGFAVLRRRA